VETAVKPLRQTRGLQRCRASVQFAPSVARAPRHEFQNAL
jgi:hypothetical protein